MNKFPCPVFIMLCGLNKDQSYLIEAYAVQQIKKCSQHQENTLWVIKKGERDRDRESGRENWGEKE